MEMLTKLTFAITMIPLVVFVTLRLIFSTVFRILLGANQFLLVLWALVYNCGIVVFDELIKWNLKLSKQFIIGYESDGSVFKSDKEV